MANFSFTGFETIMKCDNVSFKSRINFMTYGNYKHVRGGTEVGFKTFGDSFKKSAEFFSEGIRTCTAGGLIDSKNNIALGFHYFDSLESLRNLDKFVDSLFQLIKTPDKCLIIGGKTLKGNEYSMEIFQKIKERICQRVEKPSIFEEHTFPWSESNIHYYIGNDTWNICSIYKPPTDYREYFALSKEEVDMCYKKIQLTPDDYITFDRY